MDAKERKRRLDDVARRMANAKGKALDKLVAEVDEIMGFEEAEAQPELDAQWELARRGEEP